MSSLYEIKTTPEQDAVLEAMRLRIAGAAGVTLQGNRLTVRFSLNGALVSAHMVIESVTTVNESKDHMRRYKAERKLRDEKYPDLNAEEYYIEHGEWPK